MGAARIRAGIMAAALGVLAACEFLPEATAPRPAAPVPVAAPVPSAQSEALRRYYAQVLRDGQTRGLLRTDGGGPDTPFTADLLVRNFERIAFYDEYSNGLGSGPGGQTTLRRWTTPIVVRPYFGASVPATSVDRDSAALADYVDRLSRLTGHPMRVGQRTRAENFAVIFAGQDDRDQTRAILQSLRPALSARNIDRLMSLDRPTYCAVLVFGRADAPHEFTRAVAIIRAEQPALMRLSCIHEEVAQGLGLANDSPYARPSIFNDDDEFALLTNHDEILLAMLYDPRLRPGVTADEARPVLRILAREALGQNL